MDNEKKLTADYWSNVDCSASDKNFYCFPPIRSRSCDLIFGETDAKRKDWCEYWTVKKYLKEIIPVEKCLSICCGFGEVERTLAHLKVAKTIVGTDLANGAIEEAKIRAKNENITNIEYFVADLNKLEISPNEYDLIWANGALHHIENLDKVIPMLYNALKPNGFLIANEYVGPNYQQLSLRQQEIINAVKHLLPNDLCEKIVQLSLSSNPINKSIQLGFMKFLKRILPRKNPIFDKIINMPTVADFLRIDPSEGVNSSEIIPTLKRSFNSVDVKYFNGSIIMYALDNKFYNNFDFNKKEHRLLLELLFQIEDTYIELGEIGNDNAHIICKKLI